MIASTLNRNPKSYVMAIIGAEYVMRWLPKGTHDWSKFITPDELYDLIRRAGLDPVDRTGFVFDKLRWSWSLSERDLSVNYVTASVKRAALIARALCHGLPPRAPRPRARRVHPRHVHPPVPQHVDAVIPRAVWSPALPSMAGCENIPCCAATLPMRSDPVASRKASAKARRLVLHAGAHVVQLFQPDRAQHRDRPDGADHAAPMVGRKGKALPVQPRQRCRHRVALPSGTTAMAMPTRSRYRPKFFEQLAAISTSGKRAAMWRKPPCIGIQPFAKALIGHVDEGRGPRAFQKRREFGPVLR